MGMPERSARTAVVMDDERPLGPGKSALECLRRRRAWPIPDTAWKVEQPAGDRVVNGQLDSKEVRLLQPTGISPQGPDDGLFVASKLAVAGPIP
jgi:hypothetical protein